MKENIKMLRNKAGLTQEQLSEALGYRTSSIVAMWESGERKPPSDKLPLLASILHCKIGELFSEAPDADAEPDAGLKASLAG